MAFCRESDKFKFAVFSAQKAECEAVKTLFISIAEELLLQPDFFISGMGFKNAEECVQKNLISETHLFSVVVGVCGSLGKEDRTGTPVLPTQIYLDKTQNVLGSKANAIASSSTATKKAPEALSNPRIEGSTQINQNFVRNCMNEWLKTKTFVIARPWLTTDHIVCSSEEKNNYWERTGACVVDMELGVVVQASQSMGVPCYGFKVILDDFETEVPELNSLLDENKRMDKKKLQAMRSEFPKLFEDLQVRHTRALEGLRQFGGIFLRAVIEFERGRRQC